MSKNSVGRRLSEFKAVAKQYWNTPAQGNYVPYKEIVSVGIAGIGVHWTTTLASTIGLDAANFLVGASIGLKPLDLWAMLLVANIIGVPIALFRAWLFDNHNSKKGKFIPFIVRSSVPLVALSTIMVWLPFENWDYIVKAVVVELFYIVIQFFLCFYNEGWGYYQQLITPNSQERATVMSISQIIYSLAPTITSFIIPTVAGLTYGMNNIQTYRTIYPVFSLVGLVINVVMFKKLKERYILPKKRVEYISLGDAVREVAKNKYFWIINGAGWIGFLEGAYGVILGWSFVYSDGGAHQAQLGIANTIIGNAALWSMLLAPLAIKTFGKRNLLIMCNTMNVFLFVLMYFSYKNLFALCAILFVNGFVNVFSNIYLPNINADMRDYHQWKTGVRVDGLFGPLGLIGTVLGFFTGLVVPSIYEKMGLHENYDVLYDDVLRNNLFKVLIIASIFGAILNLIPYLFYDLTESKHAGYVNVLKIRAMFDDYANGVLDDNELIGAVNIINRAREVDGQKKIAVDKAALKNARKMPKNNEAEILLREDAIKAAKAKIREIKKHNEDIESMPIVLEELNKFTTLRFKKQLELADALLKKGESYVYNEAAEDMKAAKSLPKSIKEEKEIRADAINIARLEKTSLRLYKKYGDSCLTEPDERVREEIQSREVHSFSETLKQKRELKAFVKAVSIYRRVAAPYEFAKNLLVQYKNYSYLEEIESLYEKAVERQNSTQNITV